MCLVELGRKHRPAGQRTPEALIQELAARVVVPHCEDMVERHSALYFELCDAVAPQHEDRAWDAPPRIAPPVR